VISLKGYVAVEKVAATASSTIYRARRLTDERPVVLKVLRAHAARTADRARFKHRYERIIRIDDPHIVKIFGIEEHSEGMIVIQESVPSDDLTGMLATRGKLPLPLFLDMAVALAHGAAAIHRYGLGHHDIRPRNIVVLPDLSLKLGGFGADAELTRENEELYDPRVLSEVLPYVSPEQTGRMNRGVDERADLYSLGAIYYEMLAGRRPFEAADPMELIHAHLALPHEPLGRQAPAVPVAIAAIVDKLLAKDAEARYQCADGLALDLEECRRALRETGRIERFVAGQGDRKDLFQIHQRLYGRERDIEALIAAFEGVLGGKREIVLVSGYSGVGKSSLVQEILKPLAREKGYYLSGKFDQYSRDTPYSAVIQAFDGLVRQLLTESDARIERHKQALVDALGPNASVVCDVVPSLRHILGETPPAPALGPVEAHHRLSLCFSKLVAVFARSSHPLALFLDDLQWIDGASLDLLGTILTNNALEAFFFCGAYRDNEVTPGHPLPQKLAELERNGLGVCDIVLSPLAWPHILALLSDSLRRGDCEPLAAAILKKTGGNPFFVKRLMKSLYENGALRFVAGSGFRWDLEKIDALGYSDNVIDLMVRTIERLPRGAQEALKLAAAIGNRFDLEMLGVVSECPPEDVYGRLDPALSEGLVSPLGLGYRFVHDKIQEAAYSMIPAADRPAFHLRLGRLLAKRLNPSDSQALFDTVGHLNSAGDLVSDPEERLGVARMNLKAAFRAEDSGAFGAALRYIERGLACLPGDAWTSHYPLRLDFATKKGVMQSLCDQHDDALATLADAFEKAVGRLDQTLVRRLRMNVQVLKNDLPAALAEGLEALRPFGIDLKRDPDEQALDAQLKATMALMEGRSFDSILELPELDDPELSALCDVLKELFSPSYHIATSLCGITVAKVLETTLRHGLSRHSIYALVNFGMFLCARGQIDAGYAFGRTAKRLSEARPDKRSEAMLEDMFGAYVQHWKEGYPACKASLLHGIHAGLEAGQYIWAFYSAVNASTNSLLRGAPIDDIIAEARAYQALRRLDRFNAITWMVDAVGQIGDKLKTPGERPTELVGDWIDVHALSAELRTIDNRVALFFANVYQVLLCVFNGAFDEAVRIALDTDDEILGVVSWHGTPAYHFYAGLAFAAAARRAPPERRELYLEKAEVLARKVARWADLGPENFAHRSALLGAELESVRGDTAAAWDRYDEAIHLAEEGAFMHDQALGNELAARHFLAIGKATTARGYLAEAARRYDRWGAKATPRLMREFLVFAPGEGWSLPPARPAPSPGAAASPLEVISALKASQAIAEEIVLPRLLERLLRIIVENAGARRGILILKREGSLHTFAEYRVGEACRLDPTLLDERVDLAVSVVHYVARTEEDVLLDDRAVEGRFGIDPYVRRGAAKSTLVSPVVHNGRLTGVLYLDNDLVARAFTPARVEFIRLLSTQVAASIENATLYAEVQAKTEALLVSNKRLEQEVLERIAAIRLRDEFLVVASHELRTPMTSLGLTLQAILGRVDPSRGPLDRELLAEQLRRTLRQSERLNRLIGDVFDVSQIETGQISLQRTEVDFEALVRDVLGRLELDLARSRCPVSVRALGVVQGWWDRSRLDRVVTNLLGNAIKFGAGKPIDVDIGRDEEAGIARLTVEDHGIGIDLAEQGRIFDRFTRAVSAQHYGGLGLGLYICRNIVEAHGGSIRVESRAAAGARFTVELPMRAA
jgi:predicted ATPase/signal transduction histidine kinase